MTTITILGGQTSSLAVAGVGNAIVVANGGTAVNCQIQAGAQFIVEAGGVASNTLVSGTQAVAFVQNGGIASGTHLIAGGVEYVQAGGSATNILINDGIAVVQDTATANGVTISAGGQLQIDVGGSVTGTTVSSGGNLFVASGGTATNTTILNGGVVDERGFTFASGGTATLDSTTDVLTVVEGGVTRTLQLAGSYTGQTFQLTADGSGGTNITLATCFLQGTMIAAGDREIAVQDLRPGDLVTTLEGGRHVQRPVTWVGGRTIDTADPEWAEAYPVRIRTGAFADDVPHRDLLVTPEHCVLTEAGLVPVRMLVNGASIIVDRSVTRYSFFHVELHAHAILLSEGLPTESYLDTGNRHLFVKGAAGVAVDREITMAAPLAVARDVVEPIWKQLDARAGELGMGRAGTATSVTTNPDLRLLLDDGRELLACWHNEQRYMFHIPRSATPVRLLSRTSSPADVIGPFVDDRRRLGVAVDKLVFWSGMDGKVIPAADLALPGWHENEAGHRWTDGTAVLELPEAAEEAFLDVHIAGTMAYRQPA